MTSARPTAASAAAMAMAKIAIITPVGSCGSGLKRQNAMKFKFAAASIISMPIKIKMAWRRLKAASNPMQNRAADTMRKSWSVRVMARRIGLGSVRVSRAGFGVAPKHSFLLIQSAAKSANPRRKFAIARTRSPARETRALPRRGFRASPLFLQHENKRADQRGGEQEPDALQRPNIIGHQDFTDMLDS